MENKEQNYKLSDIYFLCYINKKGKSESIPFIYNENRTAITNLNNNEVIEADFLNATPTEIAKKLGIEDTVICKKETGYSVTYAIMKSSLFLLLPHELKKCTKFVGQDFDRTIDYEKLDNYAENKVMTQKDLTKFSKKASKLFEKAHKNEYNRIVNEQEIIR